MLLFDDQIKNKRPKFNHHHLWMLTCAQQCQLVPLTLQPHQCTNTTLTQTLPEDKWMNNSTTACTPALLFTFTAWFMCFLISTQQDFPLSGHLLYFPSVIQWRHWNNITYLPIYEQCRHQFNPHGMPSTCDCHINKWTALAWRFRLSVPFVNLFIHLYVSMYLSIYLS